ncbi:MAG: acyl-CoA thioester hydrolase [Clostridia bacterium]|nr:acyl-CoA thioester hydrolase [Clostridia bacterium]
MTRRIFTAEQDGFVGAYYGGPAGSRKAVILMLGDSSTDHMARCGAGWLIRNGCHALCMSAGKKDYGHHNYPLERFGKAIAFLKGRGMEKIGIAGASTTGMLALVAASYYPEITLTIAMSPSDFVMEGFYRDGKDGAAERPGDGESSVSWQGKPLPFLPYAYRHPEYWQQLQAEARAGGDRSAARQMFDESERLHPIREEERIKVERIRGRILFVGAQDDVLWDTCRYIRRMEERLSRLPHDCTWEALLYPHGTHFVFPDSMLRAMLPLGSGLLVKLMFRAGREHPKECKATRIDIDRRLQAALQAW